LNIGIEKEKLRKEMLHIRKQLKKTDIEIMSETMLKKVLEMELYKNSEFVLSYINFGNEPITTAFIETCIKDEKRVAAPCILNLQSPCRMASMEIFDLKDDLEVGTFGILEPKKKYAEEINPKKIDLAIVPAIVFDKEMNRIGYGAGYYDEYLKLLSPDCIKIGLAFDFQVKEKIPCDEHDIKMDIIVTEMEILKQIT
jgi:5-formyltetrahydrofolate cyclo-ligase